MDYGVGVFWGVLFDEEVLYCIVFFGVFVVDVCLDEGDFVGCFVVDLFFCVLDYLVVVVVVGDCFE